MAPLLGVAAVTFGLAWLPVFADTRGYRQPAFRSDEPASDRACGPDDRHPVLRVACC